MGYGPDTNVDGRDLARIIRKARRLAAEAYEKAGATMDRFTAEIRENGYNIGYIRGWERGNTKNPEALKVASGLGFSWWGREESNLRPPRCQRGTLAN